ncbi:thioesterase II family protein, partial [Actinacidiphila rubida]
EMLRQLPAPGCPLPCWCGVSACRPPADPLAGPPPDRAVHRLSDRELRTTLAQFGALPQRALADAVWPRLAPRVRGDFRLAERWRPPAHAPRTRVPLSVFGGRDDPVVPASRLAAWADVTDRPGGCHLYPGGHFYFRQQTAEVVAAVVGEVRRFGPGGDGPDAPRP